MFLKSKENNYKFFKLRPVQILALGFAALILLGAILLTLPISSRNGDVTSFLDALFTATSATCVTGLVVVDTGTHWSTFGQVVIISLIQIGGLGFMTFSTLIAIILGKRVSLKERLIIQEAYNAFSIQGIVKLVIYILIITLTIEGIGAIILTTQFLKDYSIGTSIYYGIFHSISSFCNAGFDLLGDFKGYTGYVTNSIVSLTVAALIVLGGIGFLVIAEVIGHKRRRKYTLHTKVVIITTAFLIILGAVLMFAFEYNNPKTMGNLSIIDKIVASIFASVTPRTAGANTISTGDMTIAGQFLTIILMFIGASPGSTGGGIKTTTMMILFMTIMCIINGRDDTEIFRKRINKYSVYRAVSITLISFMLVIVVTMILSITEKGTFIQFLYEATSAFGTVGLTLGLTPTLTPIGKIAIIITMYAGRLGPLTLVLAFAYKQKTTNTTIKYPEDKILVG
ncbi:TrkH family potassium uptake protein [Clostridium cylindrosporum]|uniref:Ktr system potassium uptake protein B n=1 Tax=Clostridium cylindrosporum DSM 605 TaxID=1121307 RepID=A0A0J8DEK1_CLOCY|nr:TrkH family potassium uptake protein [Clostridium cylindrosporum]KMT22664.1 Ktr system potassium uptake protein B [Clostridium cylindrosporum DSM 605]